MSELAAESALLPPPELEATLMAEFKRAHAPRWHYWYAAAAVAAVVLLTWALWRPVAASRPARPAPVQTANFLPPPPSRVESRPAPRVHRRSAPKPAPEPEQPFVAIPYTAPLRPDERTDIVRMDLPVSALIAAGFPLETADPAAHARADLVISEDGRARAVRLISISNSNRSF